MSHTIAKDEEAAAMAAMFQAQTQNWEETQEKMSQLVLPLAGFYLCSSSFSNEQCLLFCLLVLRIHSSQRIYSQPRGTGFNRGGKPHQPHQPHQPHNDKPLPPSYVCYRCGQKGSLRYIE